MRLDPDWTGLWLAKVDARPVASMTQTACRSQTTAATKGGGKGPGWGKGGLRQAAGQAWLNHLTVFTMFQLFPFRQDRAEGMKQPQNVRFVFLKITWRGSAVFYSHSHLRCRQQSPIVYTCWAGSSRGKLDETCAQRESVINVQWWENRLIVCGWYKSNVCFSQKPQMWCLSKESFMWIKKRCQEAHFLSQDCLWLQIQVFVSVICSFLFPILPPHIRS